MSSVTAKQIIAAVREEFAVRPYFLQDETECIGIEYSVAAQLVRLGSILHATFGPARADELAQIAQTDSSSNRPATAFFPSIPWHEPEEHVIQGDSGFYTGKQGWSHNLAAAVFFGDRREADGAIRQHDLSGSAVTATVAMQQEGIL
jgi:hypothetical protein